MATPTLQADTQVGHKRHSTSSWRRWPQQAWWPWLTRGVAIAFFAVVAALIFRQAGTVDWPAVLQALRDLPTAALALGGALALLSHFTYGSFDWVGRHCSGHRLPRGTTLAIAMTSYPFTLNLGSLIGGVGVRYRLYARRGVDPGTIGQVVGTSIVTNWVGYLLLAGVLAWLWQPPAVAGWAVAPWQWHLGGTVLGCLPLVYLALCAARRGTITSGGRRACGAGGRWTRWRMCWIHSTPTSSMTASSGAAPGGWRCGSASLQARTGSNP